MSTTKTNSSSSSSSSATATATATTGLLEPSATSATAATWDNNAENAEADVAADASDLDMWGDIDRELLEMDADDTPVSSTSAFVPSHPAPSSLSLSGSTLHPNPNPNPNPNQNQKAEQGAGSSSSNSTAQSRYADSAVNENDNDNDDDEEDDDDDDDEDDEFARVASRYTLASVSSAPIDHSQALVDDLRVELETEQQELEKLLAQKEELERGIIFRGRYHALGPSAEDTVQVKELMSDPGVSKYYERELVLNSETKDKDKAKVGSGDGAGAEIPSASGSATSDAADTMTGTGTGSTPPGRGKGWLVTISEANPLLGWVKWLANPLVSAGVGVIFLLMALAVLLPFMDSPNSSQSGTVVAGAGTGGATATAQVQQQTAVAATVQFQAQQQQQATVVARTNQTATASVSRTVTNSSAAAAAAATTPPATTVRPQTPGAGTRTAAAVVTPTVRTGPCIEDSGARGGCLPPDTLSINTRSVKWASGEILRYPVSNQPLPGYTFAVESPSKGKLYHYGSYPGEQPGNMVLFGVYDDLNPIIERLNVNDEIQVTDRKGGVYTYRVLRWSDFSLPASPSIAASISASTPLPPTPTPTSASVGQGGLSASQATATALASYGFDPPDRFTDKSDISLLARPEGTSNGVLTLVSLPKDGDTVEKPDPSRRAIRAMFISYAPARPTPAGTAVGSGTGGATTPQVMPTSVSGSGQPQTPTQQFQPGTPQTPRG